MNQNFRNFKKRVGQLAITVALVGSTVVGANADSVNGVTNASVNLREGASTKYEKITTLKAREDVKILDEKGNWYKVEVNGKEGYVYKTYVDKIGNVKDSEDTVKATSSTNVRTGPSTKYSKVGRLHKGQVLKVEGVCENGWYAINYGGDIRYVSDKYLQVVEDDTTNQDVKGTATVVNVKSYLNLREGAGASYNKLTTIPKGEKVDVLSNVSNGWVKVRYQNVTGYVSAKYLEGIDTSNNQAPVIAVDSTYEVKQNREFKYADLKATAYDKEDQKEVEITYSGEVNTKVLGEYKVTLTAVDSLGAKSEKVVTVKVVRNVKPVISCEYSMNKPYKVEVNKSFNNSDLKATASDFEDGNLEISYSVKDSNGNKVSKVDTSKEGYYIVTLTVIDSDGAKVTQDIKVEVLKDQEPVINFYDKNGEITNKNTYRIEQGDDLDLSDDGIKAIFNPKAYDGNGGDITSSINVIGNDKIDVNVSKETTYVIKFQVTDNRVSAIKEAHIDVVPNKAPEITIENAKDNKFFIKQNDTFDYSMLGATAVDVNAVDGTKTPCDVEYKGTVDTSTTGLYTITVSSKDAKGLKTVEKVIVQVGAYQDNTAPVISYGTETLVKNDTLEIKFDTNLGKDKDEQLNKLIKMVDAKANDEKDGDLTSEIEYDLSEFINTEAIGNTYTLKLTVKDSGDTFGENQLSAIKTITIKVVK